MQYQLEHGDCLEVLRTIADSSVDAIVTDPPYGLSFMGKRWDYDVPSVEVWAECLRVLKPGGHLLAFAGTRTQHRMAVRIEDAGFEIRDMIAWVYGSGFPKSLDVSKAIDKAAGAEREVIGKTVRSANRAAAQDQSGGKSYRLEGESEITAPATDEARQWQGWGTALKPALEPITVARKPLVGTVAANVLEHGTGALNIDGCRVPAETMPPNTGNGGMPRRHEDEQRGQGIVSQPHTLGRWPANVIHDGSSEILAAFPEAPGQMADASRSTKACMRERFRFLGIEREAEYLTIARVRIEHEARRHGGLAAEPLPPETIAAAPAPPERNAPRQPEPEPAQRGLFSF